MNLLNFHLVSQNELDDVLGTAGSAVYTSADSGENWRYLSTISHPEAVPMACATSLLGLAMASADPNGMYAAPGKRLACRGRQHTSAAEPVRQRSSRGR